MNYRTLSLPAVLLALASPVFAQNSAKIDEELTRSVKAGCTTEKVIITTRPGYRAGLADSLQRHGDRVKFQHVSIDAVSAEIHCGDIETLSGFSSVRAISKDAEVRADGLAGTRAPRSTGDTTGASAASANSAAAAMRIMVALLVFALRSPSPSLGSCVRFFKSSDPGGGRARDVVHCVVTAASLE